MKKLHTLFIRAAIRGTLAIPDRVVAGIVGHRAMTYRGQTLHPRIQLGLEMLQTLATPELHDLSPPEARVQSNAYYDLLDVPKTRLACIEDTTIAGPNGPIPVRIYRPKKSQTPAPVLLFFHGGGFVIGDLDGYDRPCRRLAKVAKCVVISVDYRLAPEHKFPMGLEDCWAVFDWIRTKGQQWELDPSRIALCGDSAGGNLAAVVAQTARDVGGIQPNLQVLVYPRTDSSQISQSGYDLKGRNLVLTEALMTWFRDHTIRHPDDVHDIRLSPLLNPNLSDLAPAIVVTCGFDPLWDEGTAYADALDASGVPVERIHMPDMIHGVWSSGGFLRGVRKLHKHIGKQVRAVHARKLQLSNELVAIAS